MSGKVTNNSCSTLTIAAVEAASAATYTCVHSADGTLTATVELDVYGGLTC